MNYEHPKRRKSKDNPYTILYDQETDKHYISFRDGQGAQHSFEIDKTLYDTFNGFELEDVSAMNEFDRHIKHSELTEATLNKRAFHKPKTVEEIVNDRMGSEQLYRAILELPEIQKRRLLLYHFGGLTYEQIAKMEGCSKRAVKFSIDCAKEKIRRN